MNLKAIAIASLVATFGVSAQAATLSVLNPDGNTQAFGTGNYKSLCDDGKKSCYNPDGPALLLTEDLDTFEAGDTYPGLVVSDDAIMTVTFLGAESDAVNVAFSMGGLVDILNTDAIGSSYMAKIAPIDVDINFLSGNGGFAGASGIGNGAALAFSSVFNRGKSVYAYFDDSGASVNRDWDDMVVRIDISAIPVPASGFLMLATGFGLMGLSRRRKKAS